MDASDGVQMFLLQKIKDNIIQRTSGSSKKNLKFEYDASGNRVAKSSYTSAGVWIESTYYVRDAQGNVMSTYHENAQPGDVVDHDPPLVQRYYEGDPATGEKPGYLQTEEERKASAADRSRMKLQSQKDSNKQGGQMSNYSKQQKEKYQLNKKTDIY